MRLFLYDIQFIEILINIYIPGIFSLIPQFKQGGNFCNSLPLECWMDRKQKLPGVKNISYPL